MDLGTLIIIIGSTLFFLYMYFRIVLIRKLRSDHKQLIVDLKNPSYVARIGSEPFTNFILMGAYKKLDITGSVVTLFMTLRFLIISLIATLLALPLMAIFNFISDVM